MLTVEQCARIIEHELGGQPASQLSILDLVNEAGEYLCYSHAWKWLEGLEATVNLVANQNYVTLPADFGTIVSMRPTNSLTRSLTLVTLDYLLELRTSTVNTTTFQWYGAILHPVPAGSTEPGPPVLALYPTPTTNEVGTFTIIYRGNWARRTADTGVGGTVRIPRWMEPCFIECLRAYARGRDAAEMFPLGEQLTALKVNPVYVDAMLRDGAEQGNLGAIRGGCIDAEGYVVVQRWGEGSALGPS